MRISVHIQVKILSLVYQGWQFLDGRGNNNVLPGENHWSLVSETTNVLRPGTTGVGFETCIGDENDHGDT